VAVISSYFGWISAFIMYTWLPKKGAIIPESE
ncbi:MAG: hypothetical protein ACI9B8_002032, partial [Sulfitobacter sp.]